MTTEDEIEKLRDAVRRMHAAEEAYGCGFYNQTDWIRAYEDTYRLVIGNEFPSYDHPDDRDR